MRTPSHTPFLPTASLILALALCLSACGAEKKTQPLPVHPSPIAGTWYPASPQALRTLLTGFFKTVPDTDKTSGTLLAVIAPHAGYTYCGKTAAHAYAALAARTPRVQRVIILGPTHSVPFEGLSIGRYSAYRTPLGDAQVDLDAVETLRRSPLVHCIEAAHQREHSVDIQVPLLQFAFGDHMPRIVPIVVGHLREEQYAPCARGLRSAIDKDTAIVVSSDFTHYGDRFQYVPFSDNVTRNLRSLNDRATSAILSGKRQAFARYLTETRDTICGRNAIQALLATLPEDARGNSLHYSTSADITGDVSSVVVYRAIAFRRPGGWPDAVLKTVAPPEQPQADDALNDKARRVLLALARRSLDAAVQHEAQPDAGGCDRIPALCEERAAFVTLTQDGRLRGCIGSIFPQEALWESVRRHARNAAINDHRFSPVQPDETQGLHIEISALTVPKRVPSWRDIRIGTDGMVLSMGMRRAVFLPQVAPEQGWTLEETLTHLSRKAGLPTNAWQNPKCEFLTFQAEVFGEEKHEKK